MEIRKVLGLDVETTAKKEFRTVQVYFPGGSCYMYHRSPKGVWKEIEVSGDKIIGERGSSGDKVLSLLKENDFVTQYGYFDHYILLKEFGVNIRIVEDSFIFAHMNPSQKFYKKGLDDLMKQVVDGDFSKYEHGSWENFDWDKENLDSGAVLYGCADAVSAYRVVEEMTKTYGKFKNAIYKLEVDLIPVFSKMKLRGIGVDREKFTKAVEDFRVERDFLLEKLREKNDGRELRINSTRDVGVFLYEKMGLECKVRTEKGSYSTSKEALEGLNNPIADLVMMAKNKDYLYRAFVATEKYEVEDKGNLRIFRPEFKPLSLSYGGRLYTKNPSINSWNWEMRDCVYPVSGETFCFADIKTGELILIALLAGEQGLIDSYNSGEDVYKDIASKIFGVGKGEVTKAQRESAKVVVFATLYGSEGQSLAKELKISLVEAEKLIRDFFDKYPKILKFRDLVYSKVDKYGMIRTAGGRYRRIIESFSPIQSECQKARRKGFNFVAQSGLADVVKGVILRLDRRLPEGCQVVFSVFDSFLISMKSVSQKEEVERILREALTVELAGKKFTFRFSLGVGKSWAEARADSEVECLQSLYRGGKGAATK